MKLPLKYIAILVLVSLTGIFAYQAYWLVSLYRTMKENVEQDIIEAMRMSDYNEMMIRVMQLQESGKQHGEVSVTAGYTEEGSSVVRSTTTVNHSEERSDTTEVILGGDINNEERPKEKESALKTDEALDMLLKEHSSMADLATFFQRGLHSGLDVLTDPDLLVYDSLLTVSLRARKINMPHRTELLHSGSNNDSTFQYTDTLGIAGDSNYVPGPEARNYTYTFDLMSNYSYRLWMQPVTILVLKQMSGILATSFIILVILSFAFGYLIRTILRQKTLEEMTSDFTNNITHELKTPIAVAYAANDALLNFKQADDKVKREKYLHICQEQLQRLSGLVEQILSMSMERRNTFRLYPEPLELKPIVDSLTELHTLKAGKPVRIHCNFDPDGLTLVADRTHFSNIISNLIDNAVKYSPGKAEIEITCRQTPEGPVDIIVDDRGIGISEERQKHIFNKFYRVPTGNLHDVKGYGLGLYYVRTMVEKHGGTVSVESEPGRGSRFRIRMNG